MSRPSTITEFVAELDHVLQVGYRRRIAILTEVEHHLRDARAAIVTAREVPPEQAEAEAVARFGTPRQVAIQYGADLPGRAEREAMRLAERAGWWRLEHPWLAAMLAGVSLTVVSTLPMHLAPGSEVAVADMVARAAGYLVLLGPFMVTAGLRWRKMRHQPGDTATDRARDMPARGWWHLTLIAALALPVVGFDSIDGRDLATLLVGAVIAAIPIVSSSRRWRSGDSDTGDAGERLAVPAPDRWLRPTATGWGERHPMLLEQGVYLTLFLIGFIGGADRPDPGLLVAVSALAWLRSVVLGLAVRSPQRLRPRERVYSWASAHPVSAGLALMAPHAISMAVLASRSAVVYFLPYAAAGVVLVVWFVFRHRRTHVHDALERDRQS